MSRGLKPDQREPKHTVADTDPDEAIHTSALGYDYHSRWLNKTARREWICMNPTPGSCIWDQIGAGASGDTFIGLKDTPNAWLNEPTGQLLAHGNDEVVFTSSVDGLDGELNDPQNAGWLRGNEVHDSSPADGQVLTWNNSETRWEPAIGGFRLTAQGDLHTHNGSIDTILPIGSSNKLLKVTSVGEGEYEPRWGDLPNHASDHESGGGDVINHQDLSGAGTNDHSVIDTHLGSSSNPHTVTPAQVGNTTAQWNANKLQGNDVHNFAPSANDVLTWNDTESRWEPQAPGTPGTHASSHESAGGDTVDHNQLVNAVGTQSHATIDTHLSNTSNPHTVTHTQVGSSTAQWNASQLQGNNVHTAAPTDGQVLKWNQSQTRWEAADESGGGTAGHNTIYADTYEVTETGTSAVTKKTFDYVNDSDAPATSLKLIVGLWMTGGGTATCTFEVDDGTTQVSNTVTSTDSGDTGDRKKVSVSLSTILENRNITVNIKLHRTGGTTAHLKYSEVRELFA